MLTKSQLLRQSSILLMRTATSSDGPMALQRSVQAVVPPNTTLVGASQRTFMTSSSEHEGEEQAPQRREIVEEQTETTDEEGTFVASATETDDYSSAELSDPVEAEFFRQKQQERAYFEDRHEEFDEKTGLPIFTYEETLLLREEMAKNLEREPLVKPRFDMAEYQDWRKEVDRETIRTQQKIEHYKRSEELLRAIQDRLASVKDNQSEKELQAYLLAKLGYKSSSYTDFISNQMTQGGVEAKNEAKRASILKADSEAQDFIAYNDSQVRDSATLGFGTAYSPDAYVPSSSVDKAPYHQERKILTQKEYFKSRAKDLKVIEKLRILWAGPEAHMNADQHTQLYQYKEIAQMLEEDGSLRSELFFENPMTKSEQEANELDEPLQMRTFRYQKRKALALSAKLKESKAQHQEVKKQLLQENYESLKKMDEALKKQDDVPSDDIKTEDITFSESEKDEYLVQKRNEDIERIISDADFSEEVEIELSKLPGPKQLSRSKKIDNLSDRQVERMTELLEKDPETLSQMAQSVEEAQLIDAQIKEMDANIYMRRHRKFRRWRDRKLSDMQQAKQDYLFFEKRQLYFEFAADVMRENTAEMSKEEAEIITEMQNTIRSQQSLPDDGLDLELFTKSFLQQKMLKPEKAFIGALKKSSVFLTVQKGEVAAAPDIPYEKMLKQELGTDEGTRRFERIDRVSLDVSKDNFDKLKLEGKDHRVYDVVAQVSSMSNLEVMKNVKNFNYHLEKSLKRVREKDPIDNKWSNQIYLDEEGPEMPKYLSEEAQERWLEKKQEIMEEKKFLTVDSQVDRDFYLEDWIHRKEGGEQLGLEEYDIEMHMVGQSGLKDHLDAEYEKARDVESQILEKRQQLATKLKEQKDKLNAIFEGHETLRKKLVVSNAANYEKQITPGMYNQDFFTAEKLRRYGTPNAKTFEKIKFSPNSKNIAHYEAELYQISQMGLHKTIDERDRLLSQFEFVFDALQKNALSITPQIRARMFEYLAVRNDIEQANTQLDRLTSDMTEFNSPVDHHYLRYHLNNCLKLDKIDGIAYLTNYFERYNVDVSDMPLYRFHSMLDYYLNHNFDLSKVMIFCKFYRQYYNNSIRNSLEVVLTEGQKPNTMDDGQLKALNGLVFANNDSLIDMRTLAKFLVRKTGDKQIIDPKTGEDTFWGLIQMFTQSADVYQASSLAKNNHIEPETVAEYFGNRLVHPDSFERVMKVAVRLGDTKVGRQFSAKMLDQIKSYQTTHNAELPQSFTKAALKDLFAKLRPQKESLSSNTSELLLYLLQQKSLHAEVIDYCDNLSKKELAKYYLTESLLYLPLKSGTYAGALEKANVFSADGKSAMHLTQRTKAVMLDKGPDAAVAFFQDEFAKLEEKAKQQKTLLVSLYDTLIGSPENMSFQEFKDRYMHSQMLASRLAKESFVVNQMEKLLKDKDYDQVEAAFNLYAVMREERLLEKSEFFMSEEDPTQVTSISAASQVQKQQLEEVRKRRQKLEKQLGFNDSEIVASIADVLKDDLITVYDKAGAEEIKKVASVFKDITKEEAATIEQLNHELITEPLSEDFIIAELEQQGFDRAKVEQFYSLLDYNPNTSVTPQSIEQLESLQQPEEISESQRIEQQKLKFSQLSQEDKELFAKVQEKFQETIKELVEAKVSPKDALAVIREIEQNPENAKALADMYYQSDYSHSEGSDPDLLEIERTELFDERETEKRHQDKYIHKMEQKYETVDVAKILGKYNESELSSFEQDSEQSQELSEVNVENEQSNDEAVELTDQEAQIAAKSSSENEEYSEESSEESSELTEDEAKQELKQEWKRTKQKLNSLKEDDKSEAEEEIIDEYEKKLYNHLDKALMNAGLLTQDGKLDPVLRATLIQSMINVEADSDLEFYKNTRDELELDEDTPENWLDLQLHAQTTYETGVAAAQLDTDSKFAHEISDLSEQEDKNSPREVMADFWETIKANTDYYIEGRVQEIITPKINRDYIKARARRNYKTKWLYERPDRFQKMIFRPRQYLDKFKNAKRMAQFRKKMLSSPLGPQDMEADPQVLQAQIHDATVFTLKEKLIFAMNKRKYEALPLAIQIFNTIQTKQIGDRFRLEDFEQKNVRDFSILNENKPQEVIDIEVKNIGQTMQKLDLLLNDSRSPIISTLVDTSKYKQNKLPEDVNDYYKDSESYTRNALDLGAYERDLEKLSILQEEVVRIEKTVDLIDKKVVDGINNVDGSLNRQVYAQKLREVKEAQAKNSGRIRRLYESFKSSAHQSEQLDEHKVRVMRDVLALELGESFNVNFEEGKTDTQFPVFFALDMINFGIKRKQPAAVRLGEKLLAESCPAEQAKLPRELAMSIKNFMLDYDNNMQYRDAMKLTGPINNNRLYHLANQQSAEKGITYCMDDPYWQDFAQKNRRREDMWRNPSIYAYRYKQYGMLGEILDMHAIQKKYDMVFSRPM